jgi:hypothetical protein
VEMMPKLTPTMPAVRRSPRIRGAGAANYAVAIAGCGGTAQLIVTWLIHATENALAPAWRMLFAEGVGRVAMTTMRESAPTVKGFASTSKSDARR